jgi:hypothetical protein
MERCPDVLIEKILNQLPGKQLKPMFLVSKTFNRIISDSPKLMGKLVLRLKCGSRCDQRILSSIRKYSNIAIHQGKLEISHFIMQMILKNKEWIKFLEFKDCMFYEETYSFILKEVRPSIEEIKFVKSGYDTQRGNFFTRAKKLLVKLSPYLII